MLDIRLIRNDPETVRAALARRGETTALEALLQADEERRRLLTEVEELKHQRNVVSEEINQIKRGGGDASERIAAMRGVSDRIKSLDEAVKSADERLEQMLLALPNLPFPEVPDGRDERDNVVIRTEGEPRGLPFEGLPHWDLGEPLGIIDFERGLNL